MIYTKPLLIFACLLSACTPWYVTAIHTGADVALYQGTGKTSTELIVGAATKKDCQWSRFLKDKDPAKLCLTKDERISELLFLKCDTYKWDVLGLPYCARTHEAQNFLKFF